VVADAPAFLAADQNVRSSINSTDVFEADGRFVEFPARICGELVDKLGNGKSFGDVSRQVASPRQCRTSSAKIWWGLMNVPSRSMAPMRSPIAIGTQPAGRIFRAEHRSPQRLDMRLDRFRMYAAKRRVTRAANSSAGDAIAPEKFGTSKPVGRSHA